MKQVIIKPIHKSKFSGISGYRSTVTHIGPEIKMSDGGSYKTGLSKEEQKKYEELLDLKPGELGSRSEWWGNNIDIRLYNDKPTFITINGPKDELKYKVLCNSSKIAIDELEVSKNPTAIFVIHDEEKAAAKKSEAIDIKMEAYEILAEMNAEEKRGLLKVLSSQGKVGKRGINEFSDKVVKGYLGQELEVNPKEFIKIAKDPLLKTKIFIADLLEENIVSRSNNTYRYGELVWTSTQELIEFLMDTKNEAIRLSLETKLKKSSKE